MHFEVPKSGLKTVKEFLGEYAMIVVSILTALALEHAAQSWHHNHRARNAEQNIEAELRHNLKELQKATMANAAELKQLETQRVALRMAIKGGNEEKDSFNKLMSETKTFGLAMESPVLRREAWEVAVASQAASWMTPEKLQRYSGLYSAQKDTVDSVTINMQTMLNGPAMLNAISDAELGKLDSKELYHTLRQMHGAVQGVQSNLLKLEREMKEALART